MAAEAADNQAWWTRRGWRRAGLVVLALLAVSPHLRALPVSKPLSRINDADGYAKLLGIQRDPSVAALAGYYLGDDPQRVHTFRPVPAMTLWVEYHLWGFCRWPYVLVNIGWFLLTAWALACLGRRLGLAPPFEWVAAAILLGFVTRANGSTVGLIATRHDLLCVLFALLSTQALLDYLAEGGRRRLAAHAGWLLLAYLSKEMALALLPFAVLVVTAETLRTRHRRRALAAIAASLAVALVWVVWYRAALAHMGPSPHASHSFGGMFRLMLKNPGTTIQDYGYNLAYRVADVLRQLIVSGSCALWSTVLWQAVARAAVTVWAFVIAVRRRPRLVLIVYCWKATTYLPVLPLHDTWPWYEYMPHLLDPLLVAAFLDGLHPLVRRWWERRRPARESARLTPA